MKNSLKKPRVSLASQSTKLILQQSVQDALESIPMAHQSPAMAPTPLRVRKISGLTWMPCKKLLGFHGGEGVAVDMVRDVAIIHTNGETAVAMIRTNHHLPEEQRNALRKLSERTNATVAEHIRRAIDIYLRNHADDPPTEYRIRHREKASR